MPCSGQLDFRANRFVAQKKKFVSLKKNCDKTKQKNQQRWESDLCKKTLGPKILKMDENSLGGSHSQHLEPERGEGLTKEYLDAKIISFFWVIFIAVIHP